MNLHNVEFIKSVVSADNIPADNMPHIIFSGKSNVGKSSVINKVLNRKNFARVGAAPGKTTHINFFMIDKKAYFVDLPGYGYAKVSKSEKERWGILINNFFSINKNISLCIQIVDIRHKPTQDDLIMSRFILETGMPFFVIANKSDKIKKSAFVSHINVIRETLMLPIYVEILPFSCQNFDARQQVIDLILKYNSN